MKFSVRYFGTETEAKLISDFVKWQGVPCEVTYDPNVLKDLRGHGGAVLMSDGIVVAKGFYETVDFWKKSGLQQC